MDTVWLEKNVWKLTRTSPIKTMNGTIINNYQVSVL
jgi:hypothetical protein